MSQESRPDVTGILPGCHRISARIRREGWPDGAGILIKELSPSQIERAQNWCNTLPRKILGYCKPAELFLKEIERLTYELQPL